MNTPLQTNASDLAPQGDSLTLEDLCRTCSVQSAFILEMLEEGVIEPAQGQAPESWRFTAVQVHHVSVAWRLQRDLGVNLPGAALALQLLDEVETLRAQLAAHTLETQDVF
jgi:chaperone modulatory protein CbpM